VNTKYLFFVRYVILSVISYAILLTLVESFSQIIRIPELAISCSFLLVYGYDFVLTSLYVFRVKLKILSLIRFLFVAILSFGAAFNLSKFYLIFIGDVSIVALLTGFTLAPIRYMVSKNYVYNHSHSLGSASKDSIRELSCGARTLARIFYRRD